MRKILYKFNLLVQDHVLLTLRHNRENMNLTDGMSLGSTTELNNIVSQLAL